MSERMADCGKHPYTTMDAVHTCLDCIEDNKAKAALADELAAAVADYERELHGPMPDATLLRHHRMGMFALAARIQEVK